MNPARDQVLLLEAQVGFVGADVLVLEHLPGPGEILLTSETHPEHGLSVHGAHIALVPAHPAVIQDRMGFVKLGFAHAEPRPELLLDCSESVAIFQPAQEADPRSVLGGLDKRMDDEAFRTHIPIPVAYHAPLPSYQSLILSCSPFLLSIRQGIC